jgi:quercetin dioxygenase-like cupin family protein
MNSRATTLALTMLLTSGAGSAALAQESKVKHLPLQEQAFPGPTYHTATIEAVVAPGGEVMPHTHPGIEMAYILAGQAELKIAGQANRTLKAGDSFAVPPYTVHSLKNIGTANLSAVSTYVVETGKPVASPAP